MVEKGAAIIVEHSPTEITSGYFVRPKKEEGKWHPIVNLKYLNKHLRKVSFKMTTVTDIRNSIQPGYYFASIDLTDAYYSVPLHESAWQYVRFVWNGVVYEYHVLLFGLAPSPLVEDCHRLFCNFAIVGKFKVQTAVELFSLVQAHFARQQTKQKDKASKLDKFIC